MTTWRVLLENFTNCSGNVGGSLNTECMERKEALFIFDEVGKENVGEVEHKMDKTAVLVMDIQKDFISETARMPVCQTQVEPMLCIINQVIKEASSNNNDVIYIVNEFEKKDWIANWFRNYAAIKGQPGAELDERLNVVNDCFFSKSKSDALINSQLCEFISKRDIKQLILVGVFAEGCISATALSALRRGYKVAILKDAVAGKSNRSRDKALTKLARQGVDIISSQEAQGRFF